MYCSAAKNGWYEIVKLMLDNLAIGANNPSSYNGTTPFHNAACMGHYEICKLIINSVDKKNLKNVNCTIYTITWSSIQLSSQHLQVDHKYCCCSKESSQLSRNYSASHSFFEWSLWNVQANYLLNFCVMSIHKIQ